MQVTQLILTQKANLFYSQGPHISVELINKKTGIKAGFFN